MKEMKCDSSAPGTGIVFRYIFYGARHRPLRTFFTVQLRIRSYLRRTLYGRSSVFRLFASCLDPNPPSVNT